MSSEMKTIVAVDVETTGLHSSDRVVTLGAWRVKVGDLTSGAVNYEFIHLIFDPGIKSHPRAEEVHGYSDWTLRHQQSFVEHADAVNDFISSADAVVAHNASFDLGFINRELRAVGKRDLACVSLCTMNSYRQRGLPGRASLGAICGTIGLQRAGKRHGALEDAWLALMVHYWLSKFPSKHINSFGKNMTAEIGFTPTNFREPPPIPDGPLPRRGAAGAEVERSSSARVQEIFKEVRPIAILLLEIARADGSIAAEEIDMLASLVKSVASRLSVKASADEEAELVSDLLNLKTSQNLLTRSARAMCANPVAREAFPAWVATMATADGGFSASEREAVDRVKAAIARVM